MTEILPYNIRQERKKKFLINYNCHCYLREEQVRKCLTNTIETHIENISVAWYFKSMSELFDL